MRIDRCIRKAGWRWQGITMYPRRILGYCRWSRRGLSIILSNTSRCSNKG
jgi:hypothetical protein